MATEKDAKREKFAIRATLFAFMLAIYFMSYFHRVSVPGTIFNELQIDFNVSATNISMLGAIFLYIYAIMQLFTGILVDKAGPGIRSVLFWIFYRAAVGYFVEVCCFAHRSGNNSCNLLTGWPGNLFKTSSIYANIFNLCLLAD